MSGDLSTWLLEQIAEDERVAQAATDGPWESDGDAVDVVPSTRSGDFIAQYRYVGLGSDTEGILPVNAEHIAAWDPKRAQAECEAKREILAEHAPASFTAYGDQLCRRCVWDDDEPQKDSLHHWVIYPCRTVRLLAQPYADREGFQDSWKP